MSYRLIVADKIASNFPWDYEFSLWGPRDSKCSKPTLMLLSSEEQNGR